MRQAKGLLGDRASIVTETVEKRLHLPGVMTSDTRSRRRGPSFNAQKLLPIKFKAKVRSPARRPLKDPVPTTLNGGFLMTRNDAKRLH